MEHVGNLFSRYGSFSIGEGNISCFILRWYEGSAFVNSVITLKRARPAGMNSDGLIIFPWNFITVFLRLSCRSTCSKPNARQDPELSPAITIFLAGIASCGEFGGGARRERYVWNISRKAAGKGFCGARRCFTIRILLPVARARFPMRFR